MIESLAGFFGPALLNAAGSMLGNDMQSDEAAAARQHSAWQAGTQRDWQALMRSTQYQTATQDMQKAGLNPMLAYSQGGAGTPSGGIGGSPAAAAMKNPSETFSASTAAQIRNIDAQTDKTRAEEGEIRERTPSHAVGRSHVEQQIAQSAMEIENIIAQTSERDASAAQIRQQTLNLREVIPQIQESVRLLRAQTTQTGTMTDEARQRIKENLPKLEAGLKRLETIYREMEAPGRETTHAFESSATGAVLRTIREALRDIIPGFGVIMGPRGSKPSKGSTTSSHTTHSSGQSSTTNTRRTND